MPIAFGMLLANLPGAELMHLKYFFDDYYIENGLVVAEQLVDGHVPMTRILLYSLSEIDCLLKAVL
jgi:hypothetical protein